MSEQSFDSGAAPLLVLIFALLTILVFFNLDRTIMWDQYEAMEELCYPYGGVISVSVDFSVITALCSNSKRFTVRTDKKR